MSDVIKLVVITNDGNDEVTIEAEIGFILKFIVGKHAELRIQRLELVDVEQAEELGATPVVYTILIFAPGAWLSVEPTWAS